MSTPNIKLSALLSGVALALFGASAEATHFRGAAMVPSVSAGGLLSVTTTSFWANDPALTYDIDDAARPGDLGNPLKVTGVGSMTKTTGPLTDRSDPRYDKAVSTFMLQLPQGQPGLYNITGGGFVGSGRVGGAPNVNVNSIWNMNSSIFWDGVTDSAPILFDLSNVQPTLVRNAAYNDNLAAFAGPGLTLSYDQALNDTPSGLKDPQPPGFLINTATGALTILATDTTLANYPENSTGAVGADVAFSGNIYACLDSAPGCTPQVNPQALRGQVEFEFMFDAVPGGTNAPPSIHHVIMNALVGDTLSALISADDDGRPIPPGNLTWTGVGLESSGGSCSKAPTFDTAAHQFSWDTAGCSAGTYIYGVKTFDGQYSDSDAIAIHLSNQLAGVPEPGTLSLLALGALGLAGVLRRRS